ncbi:manganese-dependent ADP-ribose/CDP-alcohol diphosphatase [Aplysia californica]|uniref:Manganese-dependent ADP-ribose/CDP-alcohol diphosphatase n=1 Tax=Aplysia californica TaxID=6500 RepID=A0ABM0ZVK5_APLCA|nr:manganese-dependent ADP-ribose/CDP-alcohol diphosphatase [Aplysia californica]
MSSIFIKVEQPLVSFGIITDVQYADLPDGTDHTKTKPRYYRNSLSLLKNAINEWKSTLYPVSFVIQLGDLIDGRNQEFGGTPQSLMALRSALHALDALHLPVCHVFGNHDLYNFTRSFFAASPLVDMTTTGFLNRTASPSSPSPRMYYTFLFHQKLRIVALDSYEVGLLGYSDKPDEPNHQRALTWMSKKNPNVDRNHSTGLEGLERRWVAYNGGVSDTQINWLDHTLAAARDKKENVIVLTHVSLQNEVKDDSSLCLLWNYEEVLQVIHQYPCVIAVLAGHDHDGHYCVDDHGVHHITFPGVIETRPGSDCYATARMWKDKLTIAGAGRVQNFVVPLRYPAV